MAVAARRVGEWRRKENPLRAVGLSVAEGVSVEVGDAFPEVVQVFGKTFHEFFADEDGFVVHEVEVGNGFAVFSDEHEGVGLQDGEVLRDLLVSLDGFDEYGLHFGVEMFLRVSDPFFHHASGQFAVVVVKDEEFSAFLFHVEEYIGERQALVFGHEFRGIFAECACNLLVGLFAGFHIELFLLFAKIVQGERKAKEKP